MKKKNIIFCCGITNYIFLHDKDLIVQDPEIPKNCWIDDRNNIYFVKINITDLFYDGYYEVTICKIKIKIMSYELNITKEKQLLLKGIKVY